jgi:hypothetical protein
MTNFSIKNPILFISKKCNINNSFYLALIFILSKSKIIFSLSQKDKKCLIQINERIKKLNNTLDK